MIVSTKAKPDASSIFYTTTTPGEEVLPRDGQIGLISMKIIILDDYQSASASYSWPAHLEITVLNDPIPPADLVATLLPFNIICAMRERTKITADVVNALPNLKLIATTGMRNRGIDLAACGAKNVLVCGTLSPANAASGTVEQTWGLILVSL